MLRHLSLLVLWGLLSKAQDYSVPPTWVGTSSNRSQDTRIQLAQNVLNTILPGFDSQTGLLGVLDFNENASLLSAIAIHDLVVSNKSNYDTWKSRFSKVRTSLIPLLETTSSSDLLAWGIAAIHAYRAYQDGSFLADAITIWEQYTPWMITTQDATDGSHPLRNITFPSVCQGVSVAGGVFNSYDNNSLSNLGFTASTQGRYMSLSAYLYQITDNETYHDSAALSHSFIKSHLYNSTTGYIMNNFNGLHCISLNDKAFTDDTGIYLEGLSALSNKTNDGDVIQFANQIAINSMNTPLWTNVNGVITESSSDVQKDNVGHTFKGFLVRGLYEHWSVNRDNSEMAKLIESFLNVQYNAVVNVARYPGTDWYTPTWTGPSVPQLLPWGQLAAFDVLNSAIGLVQPQQSPVSGQPTTSTDNPSSPSDTSTLSKTENRHSNLAPIVGGAVGGCLCLIVVIIVTWAILVRKRQRSNTVNGRNRANSRETHRSLRDGTDGPSNELAQLIHPFPPPFPVIDRFNSEKTHSGTSRVRRSIMAIPPPVEPHESESGGSNSEESIRDLMSRLNRALAHLPPPPIEESASTAPPRYEAAM